MTKQLIIFSSFYFISLLTYGQDSIDNEKSQIRSLIIESFNEIWAELDADKIEKFYTKDFLLLENGEVWNNDSISKYLDIAILKKPIPKRENDIKIIEIKISNDKAWVAYHLSSTFSVDNNIIRKAKWLESANAILTKNGWRFEMLHSTRTYNELKSTADNN